jgi:8-amino-7-oxononanoate synthase
VITPVVPIVIGDDIATAQLWRALWDEGVYTNVALYPAVPPGRSLIRTSVMATHERSHLDQALQIFERVKGVVAD